MYWFSVLSLLLVFFVGEANAQCVGVYPFQDNCPLPAAGLNAALTPVHVPDNAALQAASVATYVSVIRDDFSAGLGAPPLQYKGSNFACPLNAGAGDGGSQVPSADGKCWLAVFDATADVREWGVAPGLTDVTTAFNAALAWSAQAYSQNAIGEVFVPSGTYNVSQLTVLSGMHLRGAGMKLTKVRQIAASNKDLLLGTNFYSLVGTNNYLSGVDNWSIAGITFDGNRTNQSSGTPDLVNCLAVYGYKFEIRDTVFENCLGHGMRTAWGTFGEVEGGSPANYFNVTIEGSGRHGWWNQGPHDWTGESIDISDAGGEADNTYDGMFVDINGGGKAVNFHVWQRSTAVNRMKYDVVSNGGFQLTNGFLEGAHNWILHNGQWDKISNTHLDNINVSAGTVNTAAVVFHGAQNIHANNTYNSGISPVARYLFQMGDGSGGNGFQETILGGTANGFTQGIVNNIVDNGYNIIILSGAANSSSLACPTGIQPTDVYLYTDQQGGEGGCKQLNFSNLQINNSLTLAPDASFPTQYTDMLFDGVSGMRGGVPGGDPDLYLNTRTSGKIHFQNNFGDVFTLGSFGVSIGTLFLNTPLTPTSTQACTTGQLEWDVNYLYICYATNTWKRAPFTAY